MLSLPLCSEQELVHYLRPTTLNLDDPVPGIKSDFYAGTKSVFDGLAGARQQFACNL
jgi:hypothetical protein